MNLRSSLVSLLAVGTSIAAAGCGSSSSGAAPDAAMPVADGGAGAAVDAADPAAAFIGQWYESGTRALACPGASVIEPLTERFEIARGVSAPLVRMVTGGCKLDLDLDGGFAVIRAGQTCPGEADGPSTDLRRSYDMGRLSVSGTTMIVARSGSAAVISGGQTVTCRLEESATGHRVAADLPADAGLAPDGAADASTDAGPARIVNGDYRVTAIVQGSDECGIKPENLVDNPLVRIPVTIDGEMLKVGSPAGGPALPALGQGPLLPGATSNLSRMNHVAAPPCAYDVELSSVVTIDGADTFGLGVVETQRNRTGCSTPAATCRSIWSWRLVRVP
jgi:hypothetical protein